MASKKTVLILRVVTEIPVTQARLDAGKTGIIGAAHEEWLKLCTAEGGDRFVEDAYRDFYASLGLEYVPLPE